MIKFIRRLAAEHILNERNKPTELKSLDFAFIDSEGKRYYTWKDLTQLPVCRFQKLESFLMFHSAKIAPDTLENIIAKIAELNLEIPNQTDKKKIVNAHTKIAALCNEVQFRAEYITPEETFFSISAILLVREDEQPDELKNHIFDEKVIQLKKEAENGNTFFLKCPTLLELMPSLIGTVESWTELSMKWERQKEREIKRLETIFGHSSSEKKTTVTN